MAVSSGDSRQVADPAMESEDSMLCHLTGIHSLRAAAALAGGIFLIDTLSSLQFAVASLYVIVILMAAHDLHRRAVAITGVTWAFFTVFSYVLMHSQPRRQPISPPTCARPGPVVLPPFHAIQPTAHCTTDQRGVPNTFDGMSIQADVGYCRHNSDMPPWSLYVRCWGQSGVRRETGKE
jgi:hypothetical protein